MFVLFLFAFAAFSKSEQIDDLPFEDDIPIEENEENNEEQIPEENQINDDENVEAPPPPPPQKREKVPLKDIVGLREVVVAGIFTLYLVFYAVGKMRVLKKRDFVANKVLPIFREKYFTIVPKDFEKDSLHCYRRYITGRTGYQGGIVSIRFPPTCDILGWLYGLLTGAKPTFVVELICKPPKATPAIFKVTDKKPEYFERLNLKQKAINNDLKLQCFTDFGEKRKEFTNKVNDFLEKRPRSIKLIELSDINNYDTRLESQFVARFEFTIEDLEMLDEELVDFVMDLSDSFVSLELSKETASHNERAREKVMADRRKRENEENEEKPKKLTLEEQIALDKKNAKKAARRNTPRIKSVKN